MRLFGEPAHDGASMTFHRRYVCLTGAPARERDSHPGMERFIPNRWVERPLMGTGTRESTWVALGR